MILHCPHIAGLARPRHGENARVAVARRGAETIVLDDVAWLLLAQHQDQVRAAVPVEIAFGARFKRPALRNETGGIGCLCRQRRILHRRQVQGAGGQGQGGRSATGAYERMGASIAKRQRMAPARRISVRVVQPQVDLLAHLGDNLATFVDHIVAEPVQHLLTAGCLGA
ncbi:hypothetical protein A9K58_15710 [Stenotrophomonas maltophilia]|uniref:Uncharacterized protein n=1 Tax=Stenotrophomonas maltophilia TaxID=40324 RepID=A0A1A6XR43_STEMA|nr:hypothetical protein [Stenotrophomonas maltophilia]OBU65074.1 hypothetical protein A9K58_15710 [Stenotrophomonas maltophilia]